MVWLLSKSEVKQSGPLPELADSTATPLSAAAHWATDLQAPSLGWSCTTGGSYWEAFVGRKLEVDVATAVQRDNRELVLRASQTSTSSHTKRTVCLWVKCLTTTILELLNKLLQQTAGQVAERDPTIFTDLCATHRGSASLTSYVNKQPSITL